MADDQDNTGIRVPPPLIYLLALLLGLVLDRRLHVPFLSRGVARVLGWPLVGGELALAVWFARAVQGADTTLRTDKPVSSFFRCWSLAALTGGSLTRSVRRARCAVGATRGSHLVMEALREMALTAYDPIIGLESFNGSSRGA
jgi:hypothetical protein